MYKKIIKYVDFNGEEREEAFYFNLTKAELTEMQFNTPGGFAESIKAIIDANSTEEILKVIKGIILKSYGEKSLDGRYFDKSEEISRRFSTTEAYSNLYMELSTDDKAAAEFINEIMPSDIRDQMKSMNDSEVQKLLNK